MFWYRFTLIYVVLAQCSICKKFLSSFPCSSKCFFNFRLCQVSLLFFFILLQRDTFVASYNALLLTFSGHLVFKIFHSIFFLTSNNCIFLFFLNAHGSQFYMNTAFTTLNTAFKILIYVSRLASCSQICVLVNCKQILSFFLMSFSVSNKLSEYLHFFIFSPSRLILYSSVLLSFICKFLL